MSRLILFLYWYLLYASLFHCNLFLFCSLKTKKNSVCSGVFEFVVVSRILVSISKIECNLLALERTCALKKKKNSVCSGVFEFVVVSRILVSISKIERNLLALERTCAFHCIVCAPVLDSLQLHASTLRLTDRSALLRLIAPLLQSSTLADCYIHACLWSIASYLRLSTPPQSAATNQKQLSTKFFFFFGLVLFFFICLFLFACFFYLLSIVISCY